MNWDTVGDFSIHLQPLMDDPRVTNCRIIKANHGLIP